MAVLGEAAVSYKRGTPVTQVCKSLAEGSDLTGDVRQLRVHTRTLQGYLAHKKQPPPTTLP